MLAIGARGLRKTFRRPASHVPGRALRAVLSAHIHGQRNAVRVRSLRYLYSPFREENTLAHSRSAIKRWRQSLRRRDSNRSVKSRTRTLITKALASIDEDASSAEEAVRAAVSALDKAAQKGIIHANAAARGKSRLLKRYNLATAGAVASAASAEAPPAEEKPARRSRAADKTEPKKDAPKTPRGRTRKNT
jgi:small subunit ribosomal protein S20